MATSLRNISGEPLHVGRADGPVIDADQVLELDGDVTEVLEDAYVVGEGDDARAYPKSVWRDESDPTPRRQPARKQTAEESR